MYACGAKTKGCGNGVHVFGPYPKAKQIWPMQLHAAHPSSAACVYGVCVQHTARIYRAVAGLKQPLFGVPPPTHTHPIPPLTPPQTDCRALWRGCARYLKGVCGVGECQQGVCVCVWSYACACTVKVTRERETPHAPPQIHSHIFPPPYPPPHTHTHLQPCVLQPSGLCFSSGDGMSHCSCFYRAGGLYATLI